MAFSMASITGMFKRNKKARDPFGVDDDEDFADDDFGDDDAFDEESDGGNLAHKIALGVSVGLSVLLIAFIGTVILTADEAAGPVAGTMPKEISQVLDEQGRVVQDLEAERAAAQQQTGSGDESASGPVGMPALGDTSDTIVSDATTESARSAERRPWLAGENDPASSAPAGRASSMDDLLRQSRESQPAAPAIPDRASDAAAEMPAEMPAAAEPIAIQDASEMETAETAMAETGGDTPAPDAGPAELVPGAAGRFAGAAATRQGGASPGAGPRLSEPEGPPTDSRSISAAPPRFSTLPKAEALPPNPDARARVAIIIEGLGLNREATEAAIDSLPSSVTLAFSPYSPDLPGWLERARESGHEVLIEVPLESKRFPADDPGPFGLLTSLDQLQNVERLTAILSTAEGTPGILDVSGSSFRESTEHINLLMNNLDARGMFYVQGRPGLRLGNDKVPTATADIVLDERNFRASIDARLDYIEELAKYQGSSVAVASARPATFERITLWLDNVGRRGIAVAPVSQVLIQ